MLQLLVLCSSLVALALSACTLPPPPAAVPWPTAPLSQEPAANGTVIYQCPNGYSPCGNFGAGGAFVVQQGLPLFCEPAVGKIMATATRESMLATMICCQAPVATMALLQLRPDLNTYAIPDGTTGLKCPAGERTHLLPGQEVRSISCIGGDMSAIMLDGTTLFIGGGPAPLECIKASKTTSSTTTTTTAPTTTTVKPDAPATASQLWNVNYYYNYGFGVHAFCADQTCIKEGETRSARLVEICFTSARALLILHALSLVACTVRSNGIGYDMNNGWGLMGRAVSESMINSVRASCPTGSGNLRNLGFTKSGNKYLHNLNGSGLKCGWVSIASGSCGARVVIKRWKSRYTDDMMYGVDLEWNTWYQGMVQDGGLPQFYMWA